MLFTRTRAIGIVLAGIIALSGTTASAAGTTLVPAAGNVNIADIVAQKGTLTVVEGVMPRIESGQPGKTESSRISLVAVDNVNIDALIANAEEGVLISIEGITSQIIGGQARRTAPGKAALAK